MANKYKLAFLLLILVTIVVLVIVFLSQQNFAVLNPKGIIALKERDVLLTASLLGLIVVIPAIILTFFIAWKYRESNTSAKYAPDWKHSKIFELTWWAIPATIILILAVITWKNTHELDQYKPIESAKKPITIQVVALQWKWLFIYPEQNIATVNFVQFPEDTPINFELTADAPMNSFWIPQLGGQMYAMAGMKTKLHLMADEPGVFAGSAAEISGQGFAEMKFSAQATSQADFESWVNLVKESTDILNLEKYDQLANPSENNQVAYYSLSEVKLYDTIVMKFMAPKNMEEHN